MPFLYRQQQVRVTLWKWHHPSIAATYADPLLLLRPSHEVKLSHKAFLCQPLEYLQVINSYEIRWYVIIYSNAQVH